MKSDTQHTLSISRVGMRYHSNLLIYPQKQGIFLPGGIKKPVIFLVLWATRLFNAVCVEIGRGLPTSPYSPQQPLSLINLQVTRGQFARKDSQTSPGMQFSVSQLCLQHTQGLQLLEDRPHHPWSQGVALVAGRQCWGGAAPPPTHSTAARCLLQTHCVSRQGQTFPKAPNYQQPTICTNCWEGSP